MTPKIAVFLDGANFFFMQRDCLQWFADPKKILTFIEDKYGPIEDAYYYIGQDVPPLMKDKAFFDTLPKMGYSVVSKPIKKIIDHKTGKIKSKANLDIEIVLDMFNTIDRYDTAILISGDGDFERALDLLKARGKKVVVMATDGFIAKELIALVGRNYVDLNDIRDIVERPIRSK